MLKFLFILISLFFLYKKNWLIQNLLFLMVFKILLIDISKIFYLILSYNLGIDYISYWLIILRIWIVSLILMAREKIIQNNDKFLFSFILLFLLLILIMFFLSLDIFIFYFFFERSLIPTLMLILGWGYQPERIKAGLYLVFYTLFGSYPLFLGIFYFYYSFNSLFFGMLIFSDLSYNFFFYLSIIIAFFIKFPLYFFHLWLPKAHVEAPVSGSIILAGVLLKIGGYGLFRVYPIIKFLMLNYSYIWILISLIGGLLVSLICLRQLDIKSLVAYSSVSHIGVCICGLISFSNWGLNGSYFFLIGHGLCSSCLFCLVNINYERLGSRRLIINKGLINFIPRIGLWWFLLRVSNIRCPPSLNLIGEIYILNGIINWSYYTLFVLIFISFFTAAFCLYFYSINQFGLSNQLINYYSAGETREYLLIILHWIPLNFLILIVNYIQVF